MEYSPYFSVKFSSCNAPEIYGAISSLSTGFEKEATIKTFSDSIPFPINSIAQSIAVS